MSSNALLVTRPHPRARPLPGLRRRLSGDMYDDLAELEAVCAHYLAHEDERAAKVAAVQRPGHRAFSS